MTTSNGVCRPYVKGREPVPFRVVAIGEVLWDLLPAGRQLGGAPANFIHHAHALGADAGLVSRVGDDDLGREALARLRADGVATHLIQVDPQAPTGTVGVEIGPDHHPRFTIHEGVAWDRLIVEDAALAAVRAADAVCFGSLAQRTLGGATAVRRRETDQLALAVGADGGQRAQGVAVDDDACPAAERDAVVSSRGRAMQAGQPHCAGCHQSRREPKQATAGGLQSDTPVDNNGHAPSNGGASLT